MADEDFAELLNRLPGGWVQAMGLVLVKANSDEVIGEWEVGDVHKQTYGIVHGGVHCGVIETLASVGAALVAMPRGQRVVGLENSTSFIRAVTSGKLRGVARPLTRGRTTQVWTVAITDADGKLVAEGRVRLACLDGNRPLGVG